MLQEHTASERTPPCARGAYPNQKELLPYEALRTHIVRFLGPKTVLDRAVGLFQALGLWTTTEDSEKLEHGPRTSSAWFPSSFGLGVGGQSCSNFLASTEGGPVRPDLGTQAQLGRTSVASAPKFRGAPRTS